MASAAVHPFRCWALVKSELSDLSGVADFTILTHHRWLSNSFDFRRLVRKLRLSKAGSVDMYATRVGRRKVGSYGWHMELRQRSATYVHGRNLWEMISKLRLWWIMVNLCMRYYEILWLKMPLKVLTVAHGALNGAFGFRPGHRRCPHLCSEGHEAGTSRWALPWKQSHSRQGRCHQQRTPKMRIIMNHMYHRCLLAYCSTYTM